jgi:selenocysteine lyase/cysteine desulfurase
MFAPASLYASPNALAAHYGRFRVAERLLFTGHSHQAWPDCAFDGQMEALEDAARFVDDKWERAFERAERVRRGFSALLGDPKGAYALAASTHELVVRLLSALPLRERPRIVTTDGEFHTLRRQLDRLAEEGIEVVKLAHAPAATVAERLARAIDDRTAIAVASAVFFTNAHIVPGLAHVMDRCRRVGAALLVDAYHALGVVPFTVAAEGLDDAFIVGGGYKYCQLGEGNCFLRVPPDCQLRPVVTGWYAEFDALAARAGDGRITYGAGAARFAGATYDPTSHYRAARVFDFFEESGLSTALLREVSQHQVGRLAQLFDDLDADPAVVDRDRSVSLDRLGGFLALRSPRAGDLCRALHRRGVSSDYRGDTLRLGPAPYLSDAQIDAAMSELREAISELR